MTFMVIQVVPALGLVKKPVYWMAGGMLDFLQDSSIDMSVRG